MAKRPGISFFHENTLVVSRKRLQADFVGALKSHNMSITSDQFAEILGKEHVAEAIHQQIEDVYDTVRQREKIAKVGRPAIWAVQLSATSPDVFNIYSVDRTEVKEPVASPDILTPKSQDFWHAAEAAGFRPDIDLYGNYPDAGLWLRLHKAEPGKS